jgi:hypothetical protein
MRHRDVDDAISQIRGVNREKVFRPVGRGRRNLLMKAAAQRAASRFVGDAQTPGGPGELADPRRLEHCRGALRRRDVPGSRWRAQRTTLR